jgi:methionyl-tRNA formyltransferase
VRLQVLQVQPPTKKVMATKDFRNGIRKKKLTLPGAAAK